MAEATHKPQPKTWRTAAGTKIEMLGGRSGELGQWLRCPEPYEQEIPMPNGESYRLVHCYEGYKYEWVYVENGALERGEHVSKRKTVRKRRS